MDSVGGGVVAEIFRARFGGGGIVAEFFPLTAVTDPKFVLFKHVLSFARIMSTLCPNVCRQTARIGGQLPPSPPSRTPMETECHLVVHHSRHEIHATIFLTNLLFD